MKLFSRAPSKMKWISQCQEIFILMQEMSRLLSKKRKVYPIMENICRLIRDRIDQTKDQIYLATIVRMLYN